ncbi:MAG: hypothetical protein ACO3BO_04775, partial [Anaerohalosphaeraceae bacterium]
ATCKAPLRVAPAEVPTNIPSSWASAFDRRNASLPSIGMMPSMCLAAIAAGADGLIVECHPDPEHAASDGAQSITPDVLSELMVKLKRVAEAVDRQL